MLHGTFATTPPALSLSCASYRRSVHDSTTGSASTAGADDARYMGMASRQAYQLMTLKEAGPAAKSPTRTRSTVPRVVTSELGGRDGRWRSDTSSVSRRRRPIGSAPPTVAAAAVAAHSSAACPPSPRRGPPRAGPTSRPRASASFSASFLLSSTSSPPPTCRGGRIDCRRHHGEEAAASVCRTCSFSHRGSYRGGSLAREGNFIVRAEGGSEYGDAPRHSGRGGQSDEDAAFCRYRLQDDDDDDDDDKEEEEEEETCETREGDVPPAPPPPPRRARSSERLFCDAMDAMMLSCRAGTSQEPPSHHRPTPHRRAERGVMHAEQDEAADGYSSYDDDYPSDEHSHPNHYHYHSSDGGCEYVYTWDNDTPQPQQQQQQSMLLPSMRHLDRQYAAVNVDKADSDSEDDDDDDAAAAAEPSREPHRSRYTDTGAEAADSRHEPSGECRVRAGGNAAAAAREYRQLVERQLGLATAGGVLSFARLSTRAESRVRAPVSPVSRSRLAGPDRAALFPSDRTFRYAAPGYDVVSRSPVGHDDRCRRYHHHHHHHPPPHSSSLATMDRPAHTPESRTHRCGASSPMSPHHRGLCDKELSKIAPHGQSRWSAGQSNYLSGTRTSVGSTASASPYSACHDDAEYDAYYSSHTTHANDMTYPIDAAYLRYHDGENDTTSTIDTTHDTTFTTNHTTTTNYNNNSRDSHDNMYHHHACNSHSAHTDNHDNHDSTTTTTNNNNNNNNRSSHADVYRVRDKSDGAASRVPCSHPPNPPHLRDGVHTPGGGGGFGREAMTTTGPAARGSCTPRPWEWVLPAPADRGGGGAEGYAVGSSAAALVVSAAAVTHPHRTACHLSTTPTPPVSRATRRLFSDLAPSPHAAPPSFAPRSLSAHRTLHARQAVCPGAAATGLMPWMRGDTVPGAAAVTDGGGVAHAAAAAAAANWTLASRAQSVSAGSMGPASASRWARRCAAVCVAGGGGGGKKVFDSERVLQAQNMVVREDTNTLSWCAAGLLAVLDRTVYLSPYPGSVHRVFAAPAVPAFMTQPPMPPPPGRDETANTHTHTNTHTQPHTHTHTNTHTQPHTHTQSHTDCHTDPAAPSLHPSPSRESVVGAAEKDRESGRRGAGRGTTRPATPSTAPALDEDAPSSASGGAPCGACARRATRATRRDHRETGVVSAVAGSSESLSPHGWLYLAFALRHGGVTVHGYRMSGRAGVTPFHEGDHDTPYGVCADEMAMAEQPDDATMTRGAEGGGDEDDDDGGGGGRGGNDAAAAATATTPSDQATSFELHGSAPGRFVRVAVLHLAGEASSHPTAESDALCGYAAYHRSGVDRTVSCMQIHQGTLYTGGMDGMLWVYDLAQLVADQRRASRVCRCSATTPPPPPPTAALSASMDTTARAPWGVWRGEGDALDPLRPGGSRGIVVGQSIFHLEVTEDRNYIAVGTARALLIFHAGQLRQANARTARPRPLYVRNGASHPVRAFAWLPPRHRLRQYDAMGHEALGPMHIHASSHRGGGGSGNTNFGTSGEGSIPTHGGAAAAAAAAGKLCATTRTVAGEAAALVYASGPNETELCVFYLGTRCTIARHVTGTRPIRRIVCRRHSREVMVATELDAHELHGFHLSARRLRRASATAAWQMRSRRYTSNANGTYDDDDHDDDDDRRTKKNCIRYDPHRCCCNDSASTNTHTDAPGENTRTSRYLDLLSAVVAPPPAAAAAVATMRRRRTCSSSSSVAVSAARRSTSTCEHTSITHNATATARLSTRSSLVLSRALAAVDYVFSDSPDASRFGSAAAAQGRASAGIDDESFLDRPLHRAAAESESESESDESTADGAAAAALTLQPSCTESALLLFELCDADARSDSAPGAGEGSGVWRPRWHRRGVSVPSVRGGVVYAALAPDDDLLVTSGPERMLRFWRPFGQASASATLTRSDSECTYAHSTIR